MASLSPINFEEEGSRTPDESGLERNMALNCMGCALRAPPSDLTRGSWSGVCVTCASGPVLVPSERVRLCPESLGTWCSQNEPYPISAAKTEPYMQWDTGDGLVVSARKFYLSVPRDGNVRLIAAPPPPNWDRAPALGHPF